MATVIWTDDALRQVRRITGEIGRTAPRTAAKWARRIMSAPTILTSLPRRGAVVEEFGLDHLREILVGPYRVVYWIDGDTCSVVTVLHGKQDLTSHLDPDNLPT
jgi:toxin ParE1/3/4